MIGEENRLQRFLSEVVGRGPEACLPVNLSEEWRETLIQEVEHYFDSECESELELALMAVVVILQSKSPGTGIRISQEKMWKNLHSYHCELALEELRRKGLIEMPSATLETIFTNHRWSLVPPR